MEAPIRASGSAGLRPKSIFEKSRGWIQMEIGKVPTVAFSLTGSNTDQRLSLPPMRSFTIKEIADRIVPLDEGVSG